jgi:hypothetical protein
MNKPNQDINESIIPLDKNEISYSFAKEAKKLMRLPYYKLEELKKQEEKKLKNPHKNKKKDEQVKVEKTIYPVHTLHKKPKKIILKKIKEEKEPHQEAEKPKEDLEMTNKTNSNNIQINDEKRAIINNLLNNVSNEKVNKLQQLKYSVNNVVEKKIRLSRKQRRLQEAENTLGSFLSKEDKINFGRSRLSSNYSSNNFLTTVEGDYIVRTNSSMKFNNSLMEKTNHSQSVQNVIGLLNFRTH